MSAVEGQLSGECGHCGKKPVRVRQNGTVWTHDDDRDGLRCAGSGAPSKEAAEQRDGATP